MKQKDPKLTAIDSDHEIYEMLADLISAYHDHLKEAQIGLLWILEPRLKKGKRNLGTCAVVPEKWHRICGLDLLIEIDFEFWQGADDNARRYLLDHELSHAEPKLGEDLHVERDKTGRGIYKSVPHDVEEFAGPIRRWGMQSSDLARFVSATGKQLTLDLGANSVEGAVAAFADSIPDGASVTIEHDGDSVTLGEAN